jgi:hypothetical protein
MTTLAQFGTGELVWSMLWFTIFFIWIWVLITVFGDIFRSEDLSGWGKALWCAFVIVLPYLGVFVYLIARGSRQHDSSAAARRDQIDAQDDYIRQALPGPNGG